MRNLVVGTAGHIDHGKTALVKALTGIDTDQLKEEKEQGISIVPGFAHLALASGQILEIVDIPGHEKLIKNMYRGISGVDLVLMVIAADDGPMPQTREHLNILNLLEIKKGFVVITKTDLVDEELLGLVSEEINIALDGTFLQDVPRIQVSNKTGQGISEVKKALETLAAGFREKSDDRAFRMPIDRVFTVPGHGSVATGTIASGQMKESDEIQIYPTSKRAKVRAIQSHNSWVKEAFDGQRVGLNLAGVSLSAMNRGMVISKPGVLAPTHLVNASLNYMSSNQRVFMDRAKVRLHSGTSEAIARVVIMDGQEIQPGGTKYVQFRLDREIVPLPFDKYIIRSLSPVMTIGGGTILEIARKKYRTFDPNTIRYLEILENGSALDLIAAITKRNKYKSLSLEELLLQSRLSRKESLRAVEKLKNKGRLIQVGEGSVLHKDALKYLRKRVVEVIETSYQNNPLQRNLSKDKVRKLVRESLSPRLFELVVHELIRDQIVEMRKEGIRLKDSESRLTAKEKKILKGIDKISEDFGFKPIRLAVLAEALDFCQEKDIEIVLKFLVSEGKLIRLKDGSYLEVERFERAKGIITQFLRDNKQASVIEIRDLLKAGRRGAISILEYLDSLKLTTRIGDYRVLRGR